MYRIILLFLIILLIHCAGLKPPSLMEDIEPYYPPEAKLAGIEGKVSLYLFISETGKVVLARIKESSGHKLLDDAALEYTEKMKFRPATFSGEPKAVWLKWSLEYKIIPAYFVARDYVVKVRDLMQQLEQASLKEREALLPEILYTHDGYVRSLSINFENNYNSFLKKIILPNVYEQWKVIWNRWPLRFVVYQDFLMRYPESKQVTYATNKLLELIKDDLTRIKSGYGYRKLTSRERERYIKALYEFLVNKYPHALDKDMLKEAKKYNVKIIRGNHS